MPHHCAARAGTVRQSPAPTTTPGAPARRAMPVALWLVGAVLLAGLLDAMVSGVALITPISPFYLALLRLLGGLYGLAMAGYLMKSRAAPDRPVNRLMLWLVLPLGGGLAADASAWRWAERWAFAGTTAPWYEAGYPVAGLRHSGKSNSSSLLIDPYHLGEPADIPIPNAQYRALRAAGPEGRCVTLPSRRNATGAIAVMVNAPWRFSAVREAALAPCPGSTVNTGPQAANPWQ
ncbi:MAG: hypothetical protein KGL54_06295 [Sphingomonadales bacterium]|nr:hypothetical protein [Sphingomonadales bacterium]